MEFFIARQPIFNRRQQVYAYELLFRSGLENFFDISDGDQATSDVITNSFFFIGLEELTDGKKACINFTQNLLLQEVASLLPQEKMIVEVLETVEPTPDVVRACEELKQKGYLLALDDVTHLDESHPLLKLTDIIKVDFRKISVADQKELPHRFGKYDVIFLAEKVETDMEYRLAWDHGYTLFQGYYFSEPEVHSGKKFTGSEQNYLRILQEVNNPAVEYEDLEMIIRRDLSLAYKLLRFINSAYFGIITEVRSIKQALVLLGLKEIQKWISLLAMQEIGRGKPSELLRLSILRAKFCEDIGAKIGMEDERAELFLMGMFTVLSTVMEKPMAQILAELPLDKEIHAALLGRQNKYRRILETVLAYERGRWEQFAMFIGMLKLEETEVPPLYRSAVQWADQVLGFQQTKE